jgi:hypothetical protein
MPLLAALVNLNHPGRYIHWGFVQMSLANLLVIVLMILVFVLALLLPFPHGKAVAEEPAASAKPRPLGDDSEARAAP